MERRGRVWIRGPREMRKHEKRARRQRGLKEIFERTPGTKDRSCETMTRPGPNPLDPRLTNDDIFSQAAALPGETSHPRLPHPYRSGAFWGGDAGSKAGAWICEAFQSACCNCMSCS